MDPGEILVLTGPPAAGKSTVGALIANQWDLGVHLRADYFWDEFIRSGLLRPWMPESHEQNTTVINAITAAAVEYAKGGYSVLVDGIVGPGSWNSSRKLSPTTGLAGITPSSSQPMT